MDLFSIKTPKHHLLLSSSPSFTCWGERAPENGSRDSLQTPWIWEGSEGPGMKSHSPVLHPSRWASPQRSSCNQTPASRSLQWCWARGAGWQWRQQVACGSNKRNKISLKKKIKKNSINFYSKEYYTREAVGRQSEPFNQIIQITSPAPCYRPAMNERLLMGFFCSQ